MLNLHEIIELENKWIAYSNKKKKKKYLILYILLAFFLFCLILFALFYAYSKGASELKENVQKSNQEIKRQIDSKKVQLEKEKILENKKTQIEVKKPQVVEEPKLRVIQDSTALRLNIMNINVKNSTFKKPEQQRQIIKNIPQEINTGTIVISDTTSKVNVQSSKIDDISYIKEKFNETKSIYFALDLANIYYSKADYKSAREWALTANKIDPSNDESWVAFAKASYKLGFKEQAINSLNSYLKSKESKKISQTLELIKRGQL